MHYKKILPLIFVATLFMYSAPAQTLFTYGTKTVSKDEFLKAFNKNPDTIGSRAEKLNQYLDMYINFKLKIQAAYDEKLNTNAELKSESDNFRNQLAENNINAQANIGQLTHEAFIRSQKDIQIAQVFVETAPGEDTMKAYLQIQKALDQLKNGKDFGDIASEFSSDAGTRNAKGNLGYITVFTLPYPIENIVYALQPGMYSNIYHSSIGYHIFKNVSERPAIGRRKIQQILLPVPPSFNEAEKNDAAHQADSVYNLLQSGHSFEAIMEDVQPNPNANTDVGIGEYTGDFENEVFTLQKPGDISKPFATGYGYHIIKLVAILPVSKDENDVVANASLQQLLQNDKRLETAKQALVQKWMQQIKFLPAPYSKPDLWKYTDTALKGKPVPVYKNITPKTLLFSFAKSKVTVSDWVKFLQGINIGDEDEATPDYQVLMKEFTNTSCNNYYREHIAEFYPAILQQLNEFNEANLLFAAMDKHVWSKAADDTTGLKDYYNSHKEKYTWQPGVTALVVAAPTKQMADEIAGKVKANPADWRNIINGYEAEVNVDSSRFENGQLPVSQQIQAEKDFQTTPEKNDGGDDYTFIHIFNVYTQPEPRNFDDARGMVMNDYQEVLEEKWISELRKKYPVKIDDAVKKSL